MTVDVKPATFRGFRNVAETREGVLVETRYRSAFVPGLRLQAMVAPLADPYSANTRAARRRTA